MPQKLPVVSGQKGKELPIAVPLYKEIAKGTLNDILNAVFPPYWKNKRRAIERSEIASAGA